MNWKMIPLILIACVTLGGVQAMAAGTTLDLYPKINTQNGVQLAENGNAAGAVSTASEEPFEEPMMTWGKMHGYLGAGSLLAAVLAGATAPNNNENPALRGQPAKKGFHHYAGLTAAALGGAAVISGLTLHADDLEADLLDPDTMHMLLGVLGTAGYVYAVSKGPKKIGMGSGGHAAAGMAGAGLMAIGIFLEY